MLAQLALDNQFTNSDSLSGKITSVQAVKTAFSFLFLGERDLNFPFLIKRAVQWI